MAALRETPIARRPARLFGGRSVPVPSQPSGAGSDRSCGVRPDRRAIALAIRPLVTTLDGNGRIEEIPLTRFSLATAAELRRHHSARRSVRG